MIILILFFSFINCYSQSNVGSDIDGLWQSTKKGEEFFLEIRGGNGIIAGVGTSSFSKDMVGGYLYMNIMFDNNKWTAQRNERKTSADGAQYPKTGRWVKAEIVSINMSPDKNLISVFGHSSFKRVSKKIEAPKNTEVTNEIKRNVIVEDFNGVTGRFFLIDKPSESDYLFAQFKNTTTDKLAIIRIKTDDNKFSIEYVYPGESLTQKYNSKNVEVQVTYQNEKMRVPETSIINWTKNYLRKLIKKENQKLESSTIFGVRG